MFFTISAVIFFILAGTFTTQQRRTEFTTAARDVEMNIRDLANDVTTGYYSNSGDFSCTVANPTTASSPPIFTAPGPVSKQGEHQDCIFLGRTFYKTNANTYKFNVVAGRRLDATGELTADYNEALPTVVSGGSAEQTFNLPTGVEFDSVKIQGGGDLDGFAFLSSLSDTTADAASPTANLFAFHQGGDLSAHVSAIKDAASSTNTKNPTTGIIVCLKDSSTSLKAAIRIGKNNNRQSTDLEIGENPCV